MKLSLYMDDFETEKIFSYLRWVFAVAAVLMFYFPPLSQRLAFSHATFPYLLAMSIGYMAIAQMALYRLSEEKAYFPVIAKTGILFDFVAFIWLLVLAGGAASPLFPIAFLIIMHATIYWRTKGAILSSLAISAGYCAVLWSEPVHPFDLLFHFFVSLCFVWIVGLLGSMIVIRERKHIRQKEFLHEQMITDYLTGLYNHRFFQEQLRIQAAGNKPFILVIGDIDYFKCVNDLYGHMMGDEVLKGIGGLFRELAGNYGGQAFRYGGEEFTFLLPDLGEEGLQDFFRNLYDRLDRPDGPSGSLKVTMSFGAAHKQPYDSADQLLYSADQLLYTAKSEGKNRALFDNGSSYINRREIALREMAAARV
ncbi:GGDEF domain-containing protein [Mesobacillus campisalis]|uniref:GGDEF domain-containing protein n=1 Tax=Mesobacillus campisalis TaxID=1408103 RepID=UPI000699744F|nr:GGDEF domain-containing protein [Mesobacillus campisalis]